MNANTSIPVTRNEAWGFWGTMGKHASAAWTQAMLAIANATGQKMDSIRIFLDSRHGRHFADDVQNGLGEGKALTEAIHAATQRWMCWKIDRQTSKDYVIPRGMPYLMGFVIHCEICEEMAA